jgi:hypothetical protein
MPKTKKKIKKSKLKDFIIYYSFRGTGRVVMRAKSEKQAREMFYEGSYEIDYDSEDGSNYQINEVNEV